MVVRKSCRDGGVGVLVNEELHDNVVDVRGVGDRVISLVIVFEEEVVRVVCPYAPQSDKSMEEKKRFMKIYQENGSLIT